MSLKDKIDIIIDLAEVSDFSDKARYYINGLNFIKDETIKIMEMGETGSGNKILANSIKTIDETIDAFKKYIVDLSKQYPEHINIELFERGMDPKAAMGIGTGLPQSIIPETQAALSTSSARIDSAISNAKLRVKPKRILEFGYKIGAARNTATNVSLSDRGKETGFIRNSLVYKFLEKQAQMFNKADRDLNGYSGH